MDASSSYLLKIRIIGNPKKVRKDVTCFLLEKVVDSDTTNFKDFIESIVNQYPPGYQEVVHVHYFWPLIISLVQVTRNPFGHICSSTRRKENAKNASKHWVCEKVKGWLLENPKLGPKELQQKIKEHGWKNSAELSGHN